MKKYKIGEAWMFKEQYRPRDGVSTYATIIDIIADYIVVSYNTITGETSVNLSYSNADIVFSGRYPQENDRFIINRTVEDKYGYVPQSITDHFNQHRQVKELNNNNNQVTLLTKSKFLKVNQYE